MKFISILLVISFATQSFAWVQLPDTLQEVIVSNVQFVESEQIAANNKMYEKGEWPTQIKSSLVPAFVGVGRWFGHNDEATPFTTGSVVNQLAGLYLNHPEFHHLEAFQKIPVMIDQAIPTFERYREGDSFNFYPPRDWNGVRVHQPINMTLFPLWKGFTNIPQDSDTSSVVYAALMFHSQLHGKQGSIPQQALEAFSNYRDVGRSAMYYNKFEDMHNTGAYMTWQYYEHDPKMPRFYWAPPSKGTRIPFDKNDVDCVVDLNVLRALAMNHTKNLPGQAETCAMVNSMIERKMYAKCGIYYPNTYNLPYAAALATKAGETCITEEHRADMVNFIMANQQADGGWNNDGNVWIDRVQSTAFALNALLQFGSLQDWHVLSSAVYGAAFLLRQLKKTDDGKLYWEGENFFTATAIARSLIMWKSNSYTTAVAASALAQMNKLLPQYTLKDYLNVN